MRISDWSSDVCSSDLAPGDIVEVTRHSGGVTARLADGSTVRARLLVAADGRRSAQREAAGIRAVEIDYGQPAIVAPVAHELPPEGVAHWHFLPSGPFAPLPTTAAPPDPAPQPPL